MQWFKRNWTWLLIVCILIGVLGILGYLGYQKFNSYKVQNQTIITNQQKELETLKQSLEESKKPQPAKIIEYNPYLKALTTPKVDTAIKIENCKSIWLNTHDFPMTEEEQNKIVADVNLVNNSLNNPTFNSEEFYNQLVDNLRNKGYQKCLNKS